MPARVQAQYIKIDVNRIAEQIHVGDSTLEKRAREYWVANKTKAIFKRPPSPDLEEPVVEPGPVEAEEPQDDNPEEAEPVIPESPYYTTFDEARETALQVVRKEFGAKQAKDQANKLLAAVLGPLYAIVADDDGYQSAPDEVTDRGYYQSILDLISPTARYRDALEVVTGELVAFADARGVPDIGSSSTKPPPGAPRVFFSKVIFNVQGIVEMPDGPNVDRSQFLALHKTYPSALTDADGNMYVVRVVAVDPPHTPTEIANQREKVIEDLKLQRAYDATLAQAEQLAEESRQAGLASAWQAAESLQAQATGSSLLTFVTARGFGRSPNLRWVRLLRSVEHIGRVVHSLLHSFQSCNCAGQRHKNPHRLSWRR